MRRRTLLMGAGSGLVGTRIARAARPSLSAGEAPFTASGERIGDVTASSALIHVRLTAEERRRRGFVYEEARPHMKPGTVRGLPDGVGVDELEGAVPGLAGRGSSDFKLHIRSRQTRRVRRR